MDAAILKPQFQDPEKTREYLEATRWPDGPVCPHCGIIGEAIHLDAQEGTKTARRGLLNCQACRKQFPVTVVTAEHPRPVIDQMVDESAHLMTDTATVLKFAGTVRKHSKVNHASGEYVRKEDGVTITTNAVEGHVANLRRGIDGVYHHVGKHHLHRYLSEFDFRYNSRDVTDAERAQLALKQVDGKRLMPRDSREKSV